MPEQRLPMRKIRDVLRLRADGLSKRKIAASLSIGVTTAGDIIRRVRRAGLSWPLPENLSDEALERVVYRFAAVRTCFEFLGLFRWRIRKMIANQGQSI